MQDKEKRKAIKRAQKGDAEAFEKLIQAHQAYLTHIAYTTLKDASDAEDAVQNAIWSMYRSIGTLRDPSAFNTWMYQIVYNASLTVLQKRGGEATPIENAHETVHEQRSEMLPYPAREQSETQQLLLEKIAELPPKYHVALSLHYYEDMPYKDVAVVMGASVQDVSNWIHRGKAKLRSLLAADERTVDIRKMGIDGAIASALAAEVALGAAEGSALVPGALDALGGQVGAGSIAEPGGAFVPVPVGRASEEKRAGGVFAKALVGIGLTALLIGGAVLTGLPAELMAGKGEPTATTVDQVDDQGASTAPDEGYEVPAQGREDEASSSNETSSVNDSSSADRSGAVQIQREEPAGGSLVIENDVTYEVVDQDDPPADGHSSPPSLSGTSNTVTTVVSLGDDASISLGPLLVKTGDAPWLLLAVGGVAIALVGVVVSWKKRTGK